MITSPDLPLRVGRKCCLRIMGREIVSEILGISNDTIWVSFPVKQPVREGTGVELELMGEDEFICYHARVAVCPVDTSRGIMLQRAEAASHLQRRRDWRVPTDLPIWIRESGGRKKLKARLLDLTQDGAQIVTKAPFDAGQTLEMIFQLPEFNAHQLVAEIVFSDKTHPDGICRFGLHFTEVKKRARDSITWFLYDQIQRMYGSELQELYPRPTTRRVAPQAVEA